ncbi:hypothetical protein F4780DRAFT_612143 [Xylariomycetidae sp. FL0641]|nr:hypothetical protein F4780DRAFT_612143 [Xylariomycetidae sp. FL0641]
MKKTQAVLALFLTAVAAQTATTATLPPWITGVVTEDGTCGGANGWACTPTWGACCSGDGVCGRSNDYCGDGCQPEYGNCNAAAPPAAPAPGPGDPSPDGTCGGDAQYNCTGAAFGDCCSAGGWCGGTAAHCGAGCQARFGTCGAASNVTTDGSCGAGHGGRVCAGSGFGDCCSASGYCGNTTSHCAAGCQAGFGDCDQGAGDISTDGSCGPDNGDKICAGSGFGDCCSASGYCGSEESHCSAGCQPDFGTCGDGAGDISTDGSCGPANGNKVCEGSGFGDCCSASGYCGSEDAHCGAGCQSGFGSCDDGAGDISTDGSCGPANGNKICAGSGFGDCCSASGYCGSETGHCGAGCQPEFGTCDDSAGDISTDGRCGADNGSKVCVGSGFGDCCSASGYCGGEDAHCGAGCQTGFGNCDSSSGDISTDGSCGSNGGKSCVGSGFGDCCSVSGYCGGTADHCGAGCQSGFGTCDSGSGDISTDGVCGAANGKTCSGSDYGSCCSSGGQCGNTANHCGQGCQTGFSSACITTNIPTVDGTCGASSGGLTCAGGDFNGQCCSAGGFCGTTGDHCGSGCQSGYGRCN